MNQFITTMKYVPGEMKEILLDAPQHFKKAVSKRSRVLKQRAYRVKKAINMSTVLPFVKKEWINLVLIGLVAVSSLFVLIPEDALADSWLQTEAEKQATSLMVFAMQNELASYGAFPEPDLRGPSYTLTIPATAYNSLPGQTDNTPFTTASGTRTRHGVVATNFLPIGTRIKIPELYGDQVFYVEDRMNSRYWKRIDIWMEDYGEARQFGLQYVDIEVYQ